MHIPTQILVLLKHWNGGQYHLVTLYFVNNILNHKSALLNDDGEIMLTNFINMNTQNQLIFLFILADL